MSDNIKPETLDSNPRLSKDEIKIETLQVETLDIPDYRYGEKDEQLDWPLAIRNLPVSEWLKVKCWTLVISSTWYISVANVGFTPKYIRFQSVWAQSMCFMETDWTTFNWVRNYNFTNIMRTTTTSRAVELYLEATNQYTLVDFFSVDSDGFTLNRTQADFSVTLQWTCFW